jgi:hypothetical protein
LVLWRMVVAWVAPMASPASHRVLAEEADWAPVFRARAFQDCLTAVKRMALIRMGPSLALPCLHNGSRGRPLRPWERPA